MAISHSDEGDTLRCITLSGRLDAAGTDEISAEFTRLAGEGKRRIVVDISAVSFLSSLGIRALVSNAKALRQRGSRMVLCVGDNVGVARTLETTGVDTLIAMHRSLAEATAAAMA